MENFAPILSLLRCKMKNYVVRDVYDLIEKDGMVAPLKATIEALKSYADAMSDLGLKERAIKAIIAAEQLEGLVSIVEDF